MDPTIRSEVFSCIVVNSARERIVACSETVDRATDIAEEFAKLYPGTEFVVHMRVAGRIAKQRIEYDVKAT